MELLWYLSACLLLTPGLLGQKRGFLIVNEWTELEYDFPSIAAKEHALNSGDFVPGNGVPIDVDVHYGANGSTKVFVSVPRFQGGISATLATVKELPTQGNPLLVPYPSWDWHQNSKQCKRNRIVSVFRMQIDECGRLWVLDTGKIGDAQLCPPQIMAFDLNTDQVLIRYEIPNDQFLCTSIFVTPVVDVRDSHTGCKDTFVYVADVTGFGLVVYDVRHNRSWRINNKLFFPIPKYGTFTIAGESFDLMDGLLGMSLSPYHRGEDRILYFHAMASNTENLVYTSVIRNETFFHGNPDAGSRLFVTFPAKKSSQSSAEAIDRNGIMYFGLMSEIAIVCWNINTDFNERNFDLVDGNIQNLQFTSGIKVITNRKNNQEVWILTCRFQKAITGTMNNKEKNFRILAASTHDLLKGSKCSRNRGSSGGGYGFSGLHKSSAKREINNDAIVFLD